MERERRLAAELYNRAWELMELDGRSVEQDTELIHTAHTSRFHWSRCGGPEHRARGEWQCSRVYAVLGRGEPALFHAQSCVAICEEHGIGDWDLAFAFEALSRASRVAGDVEAAGLYRGRAREAGDEIREDDDRETFERDFATL